MGCNITAVFMLLSLLLSNAQAQNTTIIQQQNNAKIESLLKKIDDLTLKAPVAVGCDSLLGAYNLLQAHVVKQDSLIATLSLKLNDKKSVGNNLSTVKVGYGNYIVIGAYASEESARYQQKKHRYYDYEIIKNQSGKLFFIAQFVSENQRAMDVLEKIRTNVEKDAWWINMKAK